MAECFHDIRTKRNQIVFRYIFPYRPLISIFPGIFRCWWLLIEKTRVLEVCVKGICIYWSWDDLDCVARQQRSICFSSKKTYPSSCKWSCPGHCQISETGEDGREQSQPRSGGETTIFMIWSNMHLTSAQPLSLNNPHCAYRASMKVQYIRISYRRGRLLRAGLISVIVQSIPGIQSRPSSGDGPEYDEHVASYECSVGRRGICITILGL